MLLLGHYGRLKKGQAANTYDTDYLSLGAKYRPHLYAVLLALGSLSRLEKLNHHRRRNYEILTAELTDCPAIQPIVTTPGAVRGGFLEYILRYDATHVGGASREAFIHAVSAERVPLAAERYSSIGRLGHMLHQAPIFADQRLSGLTDESPASPADQQLPVTAALQDRLVTLPPFTKVNERFVRECAAAMRKVAGRMPPDKASRSRPPTLHPAVEITGD
jgi:dTDP-4-amino-4,6-dideoxygalactose transaminase